VKNVKDFEEQFLLEMENKHPEILAEFKKGVLADESLKKMTDLSNGIAAQFK
jgi:F-type H+-transporting ATPase subunit alpha